MMSYNHSFQEKLYPKPPIPFVEKNKTKRKSFDCGWGKLIFSHTYDDVSELVDDLKNENAERRNIAFYVDEPHVILAQAPQRVFLDPSHSYRFNLMGNEFPRSRNHRHYRIRRIISKKDTVEINRLYANCGMVAAPPEYLWEKRQSKSIFHFVAEEVGTGNILGTVTGLDHKSCFDDQTNGSSLWCLAVDPQSPHAGVGTDLVRMLVQLFKSHNRNYMDLSVLHDNHLAIDFYEKLGFERIPIFAIKHKNSFNEPLFIGNQSIKALNVYSQIIVKEAKRRGIRVDIKNTEQNFFDLICGGNKISCKESLTSLTSSLSYLKCQDKALTRDTFNEKGLLVPENEIILSYEQAELFMNKHHRCVVKPIDGEQGEGISVDISSGQELKEAIEIARQVSENVLIEKFYSGQDLRIIVIGGEVVAAAIRKPPKIYGDGKNTVETLIKKLSRRRQAATAGESSIPLDEETVRTIEKQGYHLDSIPNKNEKIWVRRLANLHVGGTIHDVTANLHPKLAGVAIEAAESLEIPVVGLDLIVKSPEDADYVLIEANERPGLANHEPQPVAQKFIDFLFPQTKLTEA